jgi:uncharacterized protein
MKRTEYLAIGIILMLAILSIGFGARSAWAQTAPGTAVPAQTYPRTITVGGQGQAEAKPDQALVQLGVENNAKTAAAALSANSTQMQGLLNALQAAGVAPADIQTQQVSLSPQYSTPGQGGGTPELSGYTATNVVQVRVRDLNKLGQMLDSAVRAGGNRVQGIQFVVSDMTQVEAQAREAAWNDAEAKAQQLAGLAGTGLGDVVTITESSVTPPRPFASADVAPQAAGVPVQPGTETVQATVQVVWALGGPAVPGRAGATPGVLSTSQSSSPTPASTPSPSAVASTSTAAPTAGTTATPMAAAPAASARQGNTPAPAGSGTPAQAGIVDPFNYCAIVGTIDAPDGRYTGPKLPSAIVDGLQAALNLPGTPAPPTAQNSFWRCMDGQVYACTVGANLPCLDKANSSRQPSPEMQQFCAAQPDAGVIPAAVTGHNTVYAWRCSGTTPQIIRQVAQVDAQGYIANIWYRIPPGYQ